MHNGLLGAVIHWVISPSNGAHARRVQFWVELQVEINSENLPTTKTTPIATARPPKHEYQIPVMKLLVIKCCSYIIIISRQAGRKASPYFHFSLFITSLITTLRTCYWCASHFTNGDRQRNNVETLLGFEGHPNLNWAPRIQEEPKCCSSPYIRNSPRDLTKVRDPRKSIFYFCKVPQIMPWDKLSSMKTKFEKFLIYLMAPKLVFS